MNNSTKIPVVIMAGGLGTRMKPSSDILPKPLLLYKDKTMIENVIDLFCQKGYNCFYIVLYHKKDLIKSYIDSLDYDCEIHYVEETMSCGTAGGLSLLSDEISDDFILCNCDNLGYFDYEAIYELHKKEENDITIATQNIDFTIPFGVINASKNKVLSILEKPINPLCISTGIHILNKRVLNYIEKNEKLDMPILINRVIANSNKVGNYNINLQQWIDMSI